MVLTFGLSGSNGFAVRKKAANFLDKYATTTGAERVVRHADKHSNTLTHLYNK